MTRLQLWDRIVEVTDEDRRRIEAQLRPGPGLCLLWAGGVYKHLDRPPSSRYYARLHINGRDERVHRIVWALANGGVIPRPFVVDHLCRRPLCLNPDHLELVTNRANILRGTSPAAETARVPTCPRGHEYDGTNATNGQRTCSVCILRNARQRRRAAALERKPPCDSCSGPLPPRRTRYCGDACAKAAQRKRRTKRRQRRQAGRCPTCGGPVSRRSAHGPAPLYCSTTCRHAAELVLK